MDLIKHLKNQREFSEATFGPGARDNGIIDHIRKELIEIEAAPGDLEEWVDVVLLALDGAWRSGHTPEQIAEAIQAKQAKNENRDWPDWRTVEPGKAIEHVRTGDDIRKAWVEALDAPDHTYDWDCHPEDYNESCACMECREASA